MRTYPPKRSTDLNDHSGAAHMLFSAPLRRSFSQASAFVHCSLYFGNRIGFTRFSENTLVDCLFILKNISETENSVPPTAHILYEKLCTEIEERLGKDLAPDTVIHLLIGISETSACEAIARLHAKLQEFVIEHWHVFADEQILHLTKQLQLRMPGDEPVASRLIHQLVNHVEQDFGNAERALDALRRNGSFPEQHRNCLYRALAFAPPEHMDRFSPEVLLSVIVALAGDGAMAKRTKTVFRRTLKRLDDFSSKDLVLLVQTFLMQNSQFSHYSFRTIGNKLCSYFTENIIADLSTADLMTLFFTIRAENPCNAPFIAPLTVELSKRFGEVNRNDLVQFLGNYARFNPREDVMLEWLKHATPHLPFLLDGQLTLVMKLTAVIGVRSREFVDAMVSSFMKRLVRAQAYELGQVARFMNVFKVTNADFIETFTNLVVLRIGDASAVVMLDLIVDLRYMPAMRILRYRLSNDFIQRRLPQLKDKLLLRVLELYNTKGMLTLTFCRRWAHRVLQVLVCFNYDNLTKLILRVASIPVLTTLMGRRLAEFCMPAFDQLGTNALLAVLYLVSEAHVPCDHEKIVRKLFDRPLDPYQASRMLQSMYRLDCKMDSRARLLIDLTYPALDSLDAITVSRLICSESNCEIPNSEYAAKCYEMLHKHWTWYKVPKLCSVLTSLYRIYLRDPRDRRAVNEFLSERIRLNPYQSNVKLVHAFRIVRSCIVGLNAKLCKALVPALHLLTPEEMSLCISGFGEMRVNNLDFRKKSIHHIVSRYNEYLPRLMCAVVLGCAMFRVVDRTLYDLLVGRILTDLNDIRFGSFVQLFRGLSVVGYFPHDVTNKCLYFFLQKKSVLERKPWDRLLNLMKKDSRCDVLLASQVETECQIGRCDSDSDSEHAEFQEMTNIHT